MAQVEVLVGSPSDLHFIWESELLGELDKAGSTYAVSACSAHRNLMSLIDRIDQTIGDTSVYICVAGWAAALPGTVKGILLGRSLATVYGIALPSAEYPSGLDAEISIKRLPPGIEVVYGGVGVEGLNNIIDGVISTIETYDPANPDIELLEEARAKIKQPVFDIVKPFEGKTKIIEDAGNGDVLIRSKDYITAGDGAQRDVIVGKAAASTQTTCNIFEMLEARGVRTHFVSRVDDVTFRARRVSMIPLELIARRYGVGSFRDRFPDMPDGTVFEDLVFEVFEKDDANHDPLLQFDFDNGVLRRFVPNAKAAAELGEGVKAGDLIGEESLTDSRYWYITPDLLNQLRSITLNTFEIIEGAWASVGGVYIDYKIECGIDPETGELLLADVIDSDSGRLRFGDKDMSKESYRDGSQTLPELKRNFDEVATLTDGFV